MGIHWIINTTEKVFKITPQKTESDETEYQKEDIWTIVKKTWYTQKDSVRVNTKREVTS